ncbi:MAG: tRNA (adenosine(37)-N6)-threonylcarbamoyltransferase complex ATPase subunit type 1 TsaE [Patescibacteria group bacterium]
MKKTTTHNEKETLAYGVALGRACRGGEVFVLIGELGAGKTKLAQGLAAGLGVKSRVNSPTFNILKLYKISKRGFEIKYFCHIDAYRLKSEKELSALGVKEIFNSPETVTVIEWAEKVKKIWPRRVRVMRIKYLNNSRREIVLK